MFHNLRSTRQTELAERYPIHVVCAWMGNSRAVAQEHYLQVTVEQAVVRPTPDGAAQKAAQYSAAAAGTEQNVPSPKNEKRPDLPGVAAQYDCLLNEQVTPTGFEPVSRP